MRNNFKKLWDIINEALNKTTKNKHKIVKLKLHDKYYETDKEKAECYKYFIQVAQQLRNTNNIKDSPSKSSKINDKTIYLTPTDEYEIKAILMNLKANVSPGDDNIDVSDIIHVQDLVKPAITDLINNILLTGTFPG